MSDTTVIPNPPPPELYTERSTYPMVSTLDRPDLEKLAVELNTAYVDVHKRWLDAEAANETFQEQAAQFVQMQEDLAAANNTGAELQAKLDKLNEYAAGLEKLVADKSGGVVAVTAVDSMGLPKVPGL